MRELIANITFEFGSTGISALEAETVGSAPNRTYANEAVVLVTTTESPPPLSKTLPPVVVAFNDAVPVGRKGLVAPTGILAAPFYPYPACSIMTARL
jgi:hypothetical protein